MADQDDIIRVGGSDEVLRFIQEGSDDIDKVIMPLNEVANFLDQTGSETRYPAGMVIFLCDGSRYLSHPQDAVKVLEDGILERMRILIDISD